MRNYKFTMRTTKPNKDGEYVIMLEVSRTGKRGYLSLKVYGEREYWDEAQERFRVEKGLRSAEAKKKNDERKKKNELLEKYNQRAIGIIEKFERDKIDWTANQFKDAFAYRAKQGSVSLYLTKHIKELRDTNHHGNAICYENLMIILEKFDSKFEERVFSEVDIKYVKKLDVYFQKRNNTGNTRKYYMKTLRAILNKAIQDGETTKNSYPFGKGGFSVAALEEQTAKRSLPNEYLIKMKNEKSVRQTREYARMLFLLSYYCGGISFVDMAHLKKRNIFKLNSGQYIVYKRQKTRTQRNVETIQVKLTSTIVSLIEDLQVYKAPIEDYLLPIVTINHTGKKLYTHIRNKSKRFNEYLKKLAEEFEFEFNLTSYVSRHTMAMQLQNNAIPREVISQVLGHSDMKTTNTYLDSLDSSVIDEAVKVL